MKITKIIGALVLMAAAGSANAVAFVIDHFNASFAGAVTEPSAPTTFVDNDAGILGGSRDVVLSAPNNGDGFLGQALTYTTNLGGDYLAIANGPGVQGTVTLVWDNFVDEDFTVGGVNDYLTVFVDYIDITTTVAFTLVDTALNTFTVGPQSFGGAGVFQVNLASFLGVDAAHVTSLTMQLTGATAWDAIFDLVETSTAIPVPAPIALLGLGMVGLGVMRRRSAA